MITKTIKMSNQLIKSTIVLSEEEQKQITGGSIVVEDIII